MDLHHQVSRCWASWLPWRNSSRRQVCLLSYQIHRGICHLTSHAQNTPARRRKHGQTGQANMRRLQRKKEYAILDNLSFFSKDSDGVLLHTGDLILWGFSRTLMCAPGWWRESYAMAELLCSQQQVLPIFQEPLKLQLWNSEDLQASSNGNKRDILWGINRSTRVVASQSSKY